LDTDLPPLIGALAVQLSPAASAMLVGGLLLALLDGVMAAGALAGVAGAATAKLLALLALLFPLEEVFQDRLSGLELLGAVAGSALLTAVTVATVWALALLLFDRAGRPASKLVPLAARMGAVFTFWWPRRAARPGEQEPDFEITMASGEAVEQQEREYIENILEMGDTTVREVMKPRPDVVALDIEWGAERILAEVASSRHSRFPVYEETIDNVIGILHLRDLFEFLARTEGLDGFDLRTLTKEPTYLPESKKTDDALRDLQRQKGHLAIVLDEYGGTAGIVTIEDLLEEIVGEIQDEYDEEAKQIHKREDGTYVITANLPLDDLNEYFNSNLEADDVDTIGGFIVNALGRIPRPNDVLTQGDLRFTVLSVERKRIGRVKVEQLAAA
jgi:CBS domain containing-hemolysin-like protein